jgi:LysR family transcriptional regulator, glycine cleavage system transcriptional activator
MQSLSRLKALRAVEATARHGSFTGAATELFVTPAAVGQLVRSVEIWVGLPLFDRQGSGSQRLSARKDAVEALSGLTAGFEQLELAVKRLHSRHESRVVTVSISQALALKWLVPRLDAFLAVHPATQIRLDVTDRMVSIEHGEADVGIRCGEEQSDQLNVTPLSKERLIIACSPRLLDGCGTVNFDWLRGTALLHDTALPVRRDLPRWEDWARLQGLDPTPFRHGMEINSSGSVIQAAIAGQGVALVRSVLVQDDIKDGSLVELFSESALATPWTYSIVVSLDSERREAVAAFRDWVVSKW